MNNLPDEICLISPRYLSLSAWTEHIPFAFWIMDKLRPRVFVELGVHYGTSYFAFCQLAQGWNLGTACFAVDTWEGDEHAGFYGEDVYKQVLEHNDQHYAGFSHLLRMSFQEALHQFADGSIDLLHIDGRHYYEDVREDFETWLPKLSSCAVVLFHDIEERERGFGVWKLWAELREKYPSFGFLHGHGLGIIACGPELPSGLGELFALSADPEAQARFRRIFELLGAKLSERSRLEARALDHERTAEEARRRSRELEQSLAAMERELTSLVASDKRHGRIAEDAQRRSKELEQSLASTEREVARLVASNERLAHALQEEANSHGRAKLLVNDLEWQLRRARTRPLKVARDYVGFYALRSLSKLTSPLPGRASARYAKIARKRDPKRSRSLVDPSETALPATPAPAPAPAATAKLPASPVLEESAVLAPGRKTVLVVSHEASRTGAPILSLNLIWHLSERYRVVSLVLGGGAILEDFQAASAACFQTDGRHAGMKAIASLVENICRRYRPAFAIVNSVESRVVLDPLKACGVPSIALVHEFAAYTRPRTAFPEVLSKATAIVFSTRITLENARAVCGLSRNWAMHILPQGKCRVPEGAVSAPVTEAERTWLKSALRPQPHNGRKILVLGAGHVQLRKGVDLFLECAKRLTESARGSEFAFAWIGDGYDVERDLAYSVYIADQITRARLEDRVTMLRSTSEIEYAYELADIFMLPSRLDPLPNVAVDAMLAGMPVVCFEETTGVADFLSENGLKDACVARYLDPGDMAAKILDLTSSAERLGDVGTRCRTAAQTTFEMPRYVTAIERLALSASDRRKQAGRDVEEILASGRFRRDFYCRPGQALQSERDAVAQYVEQLAYPRKPMPGFHPTVYEAHMGEEIDRDPFAHFLQCGNPAGPWLQRVIDPADPVGTGGRTVRAALHLHVFFPDQLQGIMARLAANASTPDLLISAPESQISTINEELRCYPGRIARVEAVPNRGRDIAPLLTAVGEVAISEYDIVGHVHTKKSTHVADRAFAESWITFLLENSIGGDRGGAMMDRILAAMTADPEIGIVYPDDPNILGWTANRPHAELLKSRLCLECLPEAFNFPIGTMFWARAATLAPFTSLGLSWDDYPPEPLAYDGTLLHALERLFAIVPGAKGKTCVTNIPGATR